MAEGSSSSSSSLIDVVPSKKPHQNERRQQQQLESNHHRHTSSSNHSARSIRTSMNNVDGDGGGDGGGKRKTTLFVSGSQSSSSATGVSWSDHSHRSVNSVMGEPSKHPPTTTSFQTPSHGGIRPSSDCGSNRYEQQQQQQQQIYQHPHEQQQQQQQQYQEFGSPFMSPPPILDNKQRQGIVTNTGLNTGTSRRYYNNPIVDSPFLSPPSTNQPTTIRRPEPLVLDPNANRRQPGAASSSSSSSYYYHHSASSSTPTSTTSSSLAIPHQQRYHHQNPSSGRGGTVQKLFQAAAKGLRDHHATAAWGTDAVKTTGLQYVHATPATNFSSTIAGKTLSSSGSSSSSMLLLPPPPPSSSSSLLVHSHSVPHSAMDMARRSPNVQAGFLQKLGANIPEFKRRFFVLRPESTLYYYLSPNDNEPRGKVDLEGSRIEVMGTDSSTIGAGSDTTVSVRGGGTTIIGNNHNEQSSNEPTDDGSGGMFRFAIVWDNDSNDTDDGGDQEMEPSPGCVGDFHRKNGTVISHNSNNNGRKSQQQQQQQYLHYRPQRRIVLEARSREIGLEWIRRLKEDRVSTLKERVDTLTSDNTAHRNRIVDLERQIEHFRMVEKDRDGALEDARDWRKKFERLDEALRLLTQQVRKPPSLTTSLSSSSSSNKESGDELTQVTSLPIDKGGRFEDEKKDDSVRAGHRDEKKEESGDENQEPRETTSEGAAVDTSNGTDQTPTHSNRAHNLLDVWTQEDNMDVEEMLDVPGTYFSALSNACRQQRESLRLASIEASTAVEDVVEATERVEAIQKRMAKAEKQLLKLWEENCSIRKIMKQKKREKRVLVREVKQLQQTVNELYQRGQTSRALPPPKYMDDDGQMADTIIGSDDERLIVELEEHVQSSIRLHERLLAGTDFDCGTETDLNASIDVSLSTHSTSVINEAIDNGPETRIRRDLNSTFSQFENVVRGISGDLEVSQKPKLLSLFDDDSESENSANEKDDGASDDEYDEYRTDDRHSVAPSLSTTGGELGEHDLQRVDSIASVTHLSSMVSIETGGSTPERQNPLHQLDNEDEDDGRGDMIDDDHEKPSYPATTYGKLSSKSVLQNGQATSRLVCPLADVVETRSNARAIDHNSSEDFQVYHVTFYSQKIGIQFQKAPPAPTKPRGLLTDAMTADLVLESNGSDKTAAELRSVASIASLAQGGQSGLGREYCPLALPEDIVLVCGFQGFDDSGTNHRPKLGARLVAFDGISVEIGKWTFDSIRKAIKARSRPLTLSFRNDFLTTEQRAVLTKAVMEVDAKRPPPPRRVIQYERPPSTTPSVNSALSHESEYFVNSGNNTRQSTYGITHTHYHTARLIGADDNDVGLDISGRATADSNCWERCPPSVSSTTSSLSSNHRAGDYHQQASRKLSSASSSTHKTTGSNFRSFSEAGSSSSVISSALAPLMANLLKGVSPSEPHGGQRGKVHQRTRSRIEPDYLHREPTRLDSTPQHQDYKSNLL